MHRMSPLTLHTDTDVLTPEQALLVDQIGNEVYSSHYAERKAYTGLLSAAEP